MSLRWPTKDPDEVLDYNIDWSDRLEDDEAIDASVWTVPAGLVKDSESFDNQSSTVWLSGGAVLGKTYSVHNRITTSGGRTMDLTVQIKINIK